VECYGERANFWEPSPYPPRSMADSPLKRERYVGTDLVPVRRGFRGRIPLKYVLRDGNQFYRIVKIR